MIYEKYSGPRQLRTEELVTDLCIVGGGLAGTCTAITAAREGIQVVLVQDRPVLGGNASSEVRLWALGATAHMNNNNRFSREGGVIDELLVENMHRNKEGNPVLFDTILLEKVTAEPNITLLLNTAMHDAGITRNGQEKSQIEQVTAYNPQSETMYRIQAPLFCDASGDGVLAYRAGASFRFGAETSEEFDEAFAPDPQSYGERLGHSIFFYTKDTGTPVKFVAPSYALESAPEKIPRFRDFDVNDQGCNFWWIEYGGRLDTIHDTETIKWELWKVVFGVWDYVKNSGNYPEAENLTIEWVGMIPGKRESRRFEGPVMLTQKDIVEQRVWDDAVSVGGWSLDLHPADGVYSEHQGCDQYHSKGVYQIPYRTMFSKNIDNLFLTGRIISATHVAFGSTRVMLTSAHNGQAVGVAAAECIRKRVLPADVVDRRHMRGLQTRLLRRGQFIPGLKLQDDDLGLTAEIKSSSTFEFAHFSNAKQTFLLLENEKALMMPLPEGKVPKFEFLADVQPPGEKYVTLRTDEELEGAHNARSVAIQAEDVPGTHGEANLTVELRTSHDPANFTPEKVLSCTTIELEVGEHNSFEVDFDAELSEPAYVFLIFKPHTRIRLHAHYNRIPAVLLLHHTHDQVAEHIGVDNFELWLPERRPGGTLPLMKLRPSVHLFGVDMVCNGYHRPYIQSNCWVPASEDSQPELTLRWDRKQRISRVELVFDTDFDHAMETVLLGHPESEMPYCVRHFQLIDDSRQVVVDELENYHTQRNFEFPEPVITANLTLRIVSVWGDSPGAVYAFRCYSE